MERLADLQLLYVGFKAYMALWHVAYKHLMPIFSFFFSLTVPKQEAESKLPTGHPMPPPDQVVASKCPFLAAEMNRKDSVVVREVTMEFQEDVEEVRTVQKGKSCYTLSVSSVYFP